MSDEKTLAEALYGPRNPAKPEDPPKHRMVWDPEPEAPKPGAIQAKPSLTEALYGNAETQMGNSMGFVLDQNISNLRNHFALTADQAAAMRAQHVGWFTGLVRNNGDATAVHTLLTERTIKPLTEEDQRDLTAKTMEQTRGKYGDDTDRLIAKAKKLIDSKPGLGDAIAAAGIGNHPAFVLPVLERVRG